MMKKLMMMVLTVLFVGSLGACGLFDDSVELPDLRFMDKDEIDETFDEIGLNTYFFVDEEVERSEPHLFIRYMGDKSVGDAVEPGTVVSILVSSGLEEDDEEDEPEPAPTVAIDPDGTFNNADDVALYFDTFNAFPNNFDESMIEAFDPAQFDEIPNDYDYDKVAVNDEDGHYIIASDAGVVFYTGDDFNTFEQRFGNETHPPLDEDGIYTARDDVALYIRTFGKLPPNYYIRYERDLNLYRNTYGYLPDRYDDFDTFNALTTLRQEYGQESYYGYWHFSNHAGQLPEQFGHYFIADTEIGGAGHSRGSTRFVFSPSDHLVYYTPNHFNTYELLYGDARE